MVSKKRNHIDAFNRVGFTWSCFISIDCEGTRRVIAKYKWIVDLIPFLVIILQMDTSDTYIVNSLFALLDYVWWQVFQRKEIETVLLAVLAGIMSTIQFLEQ